MIYKYILSILFLFAAFTVQASLSSATAIIGSDDRVDFYQSKNPIVMEAEKSILAMVADSRISSGKLSGSPYRNKVCSHVKFSRQTSIAKCTGFLVSEKYIVTAGHCIKGPESCSNYKWVFGYSKKSQSHRSFTIPSKDIYRCKKVVERVFSGFGAIDHAVIELDRPVRDRPILNYRKDGMIPSDDKLILMGYPSGLPLKVVDGAVILKNDHETFFETNLDTFGGNSGSPVLNARTGMVEGVQTRGHAGYVRSSNGCKVLKVCKPDSSDCHSAKAGRITNIQILK